MKHLLIISSITVLLSSCQKKCDCTQNWDSSITYVNDDLVSHDGKCWVAVAQGRGIEPGPWMQNGNDIWELCGE